MRTKDSSCHHETSLVSSRATLLKGMAVMLPDNLESGGYVRKNGMCGMVCAEWYKCGMVYLWNGMRGMTGMEWGNGSRRLGMFVI